jgi:ATP phosphoribosyltransferase regulatory subunit
MRLEIMNQNIHTPEGVRDIYGREYAARLDLCQRIRAVFHQFGYQDISTPSFEFLDIFGQEKGSVATREMFKFTDRQGEILALRPDMTPAIARCAVKYFGEDPFPIRLCYIGNAYINRTSLQGRLSEFTQAGVECIGEDSVQSDGEILAMTIRSLLACGLTEFHLGVSHAGFLKGLLQAAALPQKEVFGSLSQPDILAAINQMEELEEILSLYGLAHYISFDLGMTAQYAYYNGIIFRGYTYGLGEPIVTGGRYDHLIEQFGRQSAAVGFAILVDGVMEALARQHKRDNDCWLDLLLLYEEKETKQAIKEATKLREEGRKVTLQQVKISLQDSENCAILIEKGKQAGYEEVRMIRREDTRQEADV